MIRTESSWSLLPQSPNIIAPRQRGLTLTPVVPRLRSCMAPHLVDRRESRLEFVACRPQVETPDTNALGAGQPGCLVDVLVEPPRPVTQRPGVVVLEALDVLDLEPRAFQSELDARQGKRIAVREHVALRERSRLRRIRVEACDAVVQQPAAAREELAQLLRVDVDLVFTDVLDHADARDRVELLAAELAVVRHPDVDLVGKARLGGARARDPRLRLRQRDAGDVDVVLARSVQDPTAPAT